MDYFFGVPCTVCVYLECTRCNAVDSDIFAGLCSVNDKWHPCGDLSLDSLYCLCYYCCCYYCTVVGAVRRNRLLKKPSNSDIEAEMKVWLRQSCDANGGRRAREQKKKRADDSDVEPSD